MDDKKFGKDVSGQEPPRSFILDSTSVEFREDYDIIKEAVKQDGIRFKFPSGFSPVNLLDECRVMANLDDFEMVYDLMMGMLVDRDVTIELKDNKMQWHEVCSFHVTSKDMNLRGIDFIDEYPVVVFWMGEFVSGMLSKKFPVPGNVLKSASQSPEKMRNTKEKTK